MDPSQFLLGAETKSVRGLPFVATVYFTLAPNTSFSIAFPGRVFLAAMHPNRPQFCGGVLEFGERAQGAGRRGRRYPVLSQGIYCTSIYRVVFLVLIVAV